ncbi:hypothetical protein BGZ60DRAFT_427690 [Tricladium varicosporioides]|nr:hypothetical protein BGZ60DRAFT_427690 [Hymenoscyphus varicosporioides]
MSGNKVASLLSDTLSSLKGTAELCSTLNGVDEPVPLVFSSAGSWVSLVQQLLQNSQLQLEAGNLNTDDDDLVDALKASKKASKCLEGIFKEIAPAGEMPRLDRYQGAVRQRGKDRVEVVLLELLEGVNELVGDELIEATTEQTKELCDAVEELSVMEPSVPEGKAGFSYSGSGDQINNTGSGNVNINKGRGSQNIAKNIRMGK